MSQHRSSDQFNSNGRSVGWRLTTILLLLGVALQLFAGEADDLHWAYRKPVRVEPPRRASLEHADQVRNPIDQFVLARLEETGLEPAPPADRATLVRRACFDLLGLPPTPEQVEKFVHNDSTTAWAELIETLLSSKHYGERWARHWLDVARYADSSGYEGDIYYRNAWRYRDYVVKSFNDDKPYDIFVQEQIAADELWPDNMDLDPRRVYIISEEKRRHLEARTGTGFYALGPRVGESGLDAKRLNYETMTDWANTTASAFMGLTLACARCHDHKFDPFTQQDYFSLQAVFAGAKEVELPLWDAMVETNWRAHYPLVLAADEARTAYRLFEQMTRGKTLPPEEEKRKQELLAAVGRAVVKLPEGWSGQGVELPYDSLMQIPSISVLGRRHPALIPAVHLLNRGELDRPRERMEPALPATLARANQGTEIRIEGVPIQNLQRHGKVSAGQQSLLLDQISDWNRQHLATRPGDSRLDARIANYELAFRMQTAAPAVIDLSQESESTLALYGIDKGHSERFGKMCLMARRMIESGVRYVQLTNGDGDWDAHKNCKGNHAGQGRKVDQPIAGLISDLEQRGLLESTLLVWTGEFGRTPVRQGSNGRDHHPYGFSGWLAGGGVVGGQTIGATDDFGFAAVEDKVHVNDLHATMLGLLGIDHEQLTYPFEGRAHRLTDVGGNNNLASRLVGG